MCLITTAHIQKDFTLEPVFAQTSGQRPPIQVVSQPSLGPRVSVVELSPFRKATVRILP